jgi:hypothetical protein
MKIARDFLEEIDRLCQAKGINDQPILVVGVQGRRFGFLL